MAMRRLGTSTTTPLNSYQACCAIREFFESHGTITIIGARSITSKLTNHQLSRFVYINPIDMHKSLAMRSRVRALWPARCSL